MNPQDKLDDNKEILALLKKRLEFGRKKYGHGVIVADDTRKYGTNADSWEMMQLEEALDGMIYSAAAMIRILRARGAAPGKGAAPGAVTL